MKLPCVRILGLLGLLLLLSSDASAQSTLINGDRIITGWLNYCLATSGTDAYACEFATGTLPDITEYNTGAFYAFKADVANTGPATINFSGVGAITIVKMVGGITTALADNDIRAGQIVVVYYDATGPTMQMTSQVGTHPTQLAANGGNCAVAGTFPNGVDAAGVSENCVTLSAVNPQTGTYPVVAADFDGYKTITVASGTFTITLVASGTQPAAGKYIRILNYGAGVVTVARNGQNLNGGVTSLTIPASSATAPTTAFIVSDGTNYFASLDSAGGGIASLEGQTGATQTFTDDTNVTIVSGSNAHVITWAGALAKARQHAATAYTDAANTWITGAQDFGAATSLKVPTAASPTPTVDGLIAYNSTKDAYVGGAGQGGTHVFSTVVCAASGTSANVDDSGAGADVDHSITCTLPANFLQQNKILRVNILGTVATGAGTPPGFTDKLKFGAQTLYSMAAAPAVTASTTRAGRREFMLYALDAPGAAANVFVAGGEADPSYYWLDVRANNTAQPIAVATNGSLVVTYSTQWASNVANTHTFTMRAMIVEALN